ncbi:protein phosphatase 1G [Ciona intestinalis]
MGAYLSNPSVEKRSSDLVSEKKYSCGVSGMQGWRISMEDAHNCIPEVDEDTGLFAVYDGHGGGEVAMYCSYYFADVLKQTEEYKDGKMGEALKATFMKIDRKLKEPRIIKELKLISEREPGDPPPTEEELTKKDEEEENVEDETRLLYEEATMSIEDLLAKYGRVANETKEAIESIKHSSDDVTDDVTTSKSSINVSDLKTDNGDNAKDVSSSETSPSKSATSASNENEKKIEQKEEKESDNVGNKEEISCNKDTNTEDTNLSNGKQKEEPKAESGDGKKKIQLKKLKKTFVKSKPPPQEEEDSDDDDFENEDFDEDEEEESEEETSEEEDEEEEEENAPSLEVLANSASSGIEEPGSDSGTTAVVALLSGLDLHVANAGDSRCVLCRKDGKAFDMSDDHKPEDETELKRITAAGGHVNVQGRVNGGLNLSRAIGDHCYKTNKDFPLEDQMISAMPDVRSVKLQPTDEFMVLACDGIWNVYSSQEVVDFVRSRLHPEKCKNSSENGNGDVEKKKSEKKLSSICEELFDKCLAPDTMGDGTGCDNMTCMIIQFNSAWLGGQQDMLDTPDTVMTNDLLLSATENRSDVQTKGISNDIDAIDSTASGDKADLNELNSKIDENPLKLKRPRSEENENVRTVAENGLENASKKIKSCSE